MTLDTLRRKLAEALSTDRQEVFPAFPAGEKRRGDAPFGVLSLESVELKALGFGRSSARRGTLKFKLTAYAADGDAATAALQALAARCESEDVRGLLGDCGFSAGSLRDGKYGLCAADGELRGEVLMQLREEQEPEVIVLNLRGHLKISGEGEIS